MKQKIPYIFGDTGFTEVTKSKQEDSPSTEKWIKKMCIYKQQNVTQPKKKKKKEQQNNAIWSNMFRHRNCHTE